MQSAYVAHVCKFESLVSALVAHALAHTSAHSCTNQCIWLNTYEKCSKTTVIKKNKHCLLKFMLFTAVHACTPFAHFQNLLRVMHMCSALKTTGVHTAAHAQHTKDSAYAQIQITYLCISCAWMHMHIHNIQEIEKIKCENVQKQT